MLPLATVFAQTNTYGNLTPEEIQKRAAKMGYTVDTNQVKMLEQSQGTNQTTPNVALPPSSRVVSHAIASPPPPAARSHYFVPAFADRPGADRLTAFGYNVFTYSPTTFQPAENVPTPVNYVVGPGDEIILSLWGETQLVQDLVVSKNGDIYIPNVGLINVSGLTMGQLRQKLYDRLSKVYSSLRAASSGYAGTHLNVSTGQLRSVKIYVLGEVAKPGGYTLPALSSAFTALYYSGGPTINGTLRNVEVVRNGNVVANIDLYNYLIKGNQSDDIHLNDGDIVFVPPAGKRVAILGSIFRPAIYELKRGETLGDLLKFASGLDFNAYYQTVHINRVVPFSERGDYRNNILNIDLSFKSVKALDQSSYRLDDGDVVTVNPINNLPANKVTIEGDVRQPGVYELTGNGMTVSDLIAKADSLLPDAFLGKATLIRTLRSGRKEFLSFDLGKAMDANSTDDPVLGNRDSVYVFRDEEFFPTRTVTISGEVRRPGIFPRLKGMTLTDLIVDAGGLTYFATTKDVEITRMDTVNSDVFATRYIVNLPEDYWNIRRRMDFALRDFDHVLVKADSAKRLPETVEITGQVAFPGSYTILYRGERLANFITRAGGLKSSAYTEGMYLVRTNRQLRLLKAASIPDTTFFRIYRGQPIINRSQFDSEFGNRIPIRWGAITRDTSSIYNLQLNPGDSLVVPKDPGTVTVAGDVGLPSTVPYRNGAGLSYYIKQAGGYTTTSADGKEIVLLPNGAKWYSSGWFFIPDPKILAGSVIYVPSEIKTPGVSAWPAIRDIITVVSSAAVLILTISKL